MFKKGDVVRLNVHVGDNQTAREFESQDGQTGVVTELGSSGDSYCWVRFFNGALWPLDHHHHGDNWPIYNEKLEKLNGE